MLCPWSWAPSGTPEAVALSQVVIIPHVLLYLLLNSASLQCSGSSWQPLTTSTPPQLHTRGERRGCKMLGKFQISAWQTCIRMESSLRWKSLSTRGSRRACRGSFSLALKTRGLMRLSALAFTTGQVSTSSTLLCMGPNSVRGCLTSPSFVPQSVQELR